MDTRKDASETKGRTRTAWLTVREQLYFLTALSGFLALLLSQELAMVLNADVLC